MFHNFGIAAGRLMAADRSGFKRPCAALAGYPQTGLTAQAAGDVLRYRVKLAAR
jgi:hypothetical protein